MLIPKTDHMPMPFTLTVAAGCPGKITYVYSIGPSQDGPGAVKILYLPAECKNHKVTGVSHYTSH